MRKFVSSQQSLALNNKSKLLVTKLETTEMLESSGKGAVLNKK